jgi:hypothetical protein
MAGRSTDVAAAYRGVAVTPHDSTIIPATRALYIGVTGDLTVVFAGGGSGILFNAAPVGILPVQVIQVLDTGTDATDIVALY